MEHVDKDTVRAVDRDVIKQQGEQKEEMALLSFLIGFIIGGWWGD